MANESTLRKETQEDYQRRVNLVTEYIEKHLDQPLDIKTLAEISNFSPYHFHRIMRSFLNESLTQHIIRLRIESAAKQLRYTDLSIQEIAWQAGFDAPSSLTKAFRKFFSQSPSAYRKNSSDISTILSDRKIYSERTVTPRVVDLQPIKVIYIRILGSYGNANYKDAWEKIWEFAKQHQLNLQSIERFGITFDDPNITRFDRIRYEACLSADVYIPTNGKIGTKLIEGGLYAVFKHHGGLNKLDETYHTIYRMWLPSNGYKLRNAPTFEKYSVDISGHYWETEVYLPIEP